MSHAVSRTICVDFTQVLENTNNVLLKQRFNNLLHQKLDLYSIYKVGMTNNPYARKHGHRFRSWIAYPEFLEAHGFKAEDHKQAHPLERDGGLVSIVKL